MTPDDLPHDFFDDAYRGTPPWDAGEPQPDLIGLLDELPPAGPVLDAGCGTGDLALELARRGLVVLGVDVAPRAIEKARAKAPAAGTAVSQRVEFQVGDALHPTRLSGPFGAVVDSGFFHVFGPADRADFARELAASLPPGGRYYLLGFAIEPLQGGPKQVREDELRALFTPEAGWRTLVIRTAEFVVRSSPAGVPAIAAAFERLPAE